jgi:hypothetical protein|tara:strand:+ start:97 stop:1365 length:1269 start_codon:yes stop_codon:yes gene_type:complete
MSRILRRPMFRGGGPVNSYGTGIAAPLVPGYQGGGQIGGGSIYGIPMADGRYGFKKPIRFDDSGITGISDKSGTDLLYESGAIAPREVNVEVPGVVDENDQLTVSEILANQEKFNKKIGTNTWDEFITIDGSGKRSSVSQPKKIRNPNYLPPMKTITRTNKRGTGTSTVQVPMSKEEIERMLTTTKPGEETIYPGSEEIKDIPEDNKITENNLPEELEIDARTLMKDNQALFEEMLGLKKARGQDISDMLLRFSGSQGNTLGEKFQNYTALESAAGPGRAEQIGKTAAGLSIQDYIAGKRADEQIQKLKEVETFRSNLKTDQYTIDPAVDSFSEALDKTVLKYGGKEGKADSVSIIAETIKKFEPGKRVYAPEVSAKELKDVKPKDLNIGINIVVLRNGQKYIIEKTGEGPNDFELLEKYSL